MQNCYKNGIRAALLSLGCRSNQYESDAFAHELQKRGFCLVGIDEEADLFVLNTCTVTAEAGRKCAQMLRRARRRNPTALIAAMGCHSQLEDLSELVDYSCGTSGRKELLEAICRHFGLDAPEAEGEVEGETTDLKPRHPLKAEAAISRERNYEDFGAFGRQSETRAQIKIEDGCDAFCSYCAIVLARGRVRSRKRTSILEEARQLIESGYREIVLTGIHLASFEKDLGRDSIALVELCEELDALPGLKRLRFGSLEPASLSEEFLRRLKNLRSFCPHLHLSLQSGSDTVLQRMRRRYSAAEYAEAVAAARKYFPDLGLSTDMMSGFPGETEAESEESLAFAREMAFSKIHVFRYSKRKGTIAAQMKNQVTAEASKHRAEALGQLSDEMGARFAESLVGSRQKILIEEGAGRVYRGYSPNYVMTEFDLPEAYLQKGGAAPKNEIFQWPCGEIVEVEITEAHGSRLQGRFISEA